VKNRKVFNADASSNLVMDDAIQDGSSDANKENFKASTIRNITSAMHDWQRYGSE